MRGYTNATGGATLANIDFDRDAFLQYLADLGSINENVQEIRDFVDSLAYSFSSGTISADKFITKGNNLMPDLDSFERQINRSIPIFPNDGITNIVQTNEAFHGEASLRVETPVEEYVPYIFYLNPISATDEPWINLTAFNYFFSYYIKTPSPTNITGFIGLSTVGESLDIRIPFSVNSTDEWKRIFPLNEDLTAQFFTLTKEEDLRLQIQIDQAGAIIYIDAIQLEYKYIDTITPTLFSPGGRVIIEGGNIRANSIMARDSVFADAAIVDANIANINAGKINAGIVNTNVVTVGDLNYGLMTIANNNISFYEPIQTLPENHQGPLSPEYVNLRVSIGKLQADKTPEESLWGMRVIASDGTSVLFNEDGLTRIGTEDGLTKTDLVSVDELTEQLNLEGSKIRASSIDAKVSIAADSIVAELIAAEEIKGFHITAEAIDATHIQTETINATHLNSEIITSKRILLGNTVVTAGIDGDGFSSESIRFFAGQSYPARGSAPFRVTQSGNLYASNATITGDITATNGTFNGTVNATAGNFTGTVTVGTAGNKINIKGTGSPEDTAIYSGASTFGSGGFWMDALGRFSLGDIATSGLSWQSGTLQIKGNISGSTGTFEGTVSASNIEAGTLNVGVKLSAAQIDTGTLTSISINNGNGKFTVSSAGIMTAQAANIEGAVTASSGKIGDFTITDGNLSSSYSTPNNITLRRSTADGSYSGLVVTRELGGLGISSQYGATGITYRVNGVIVGDPNVSINNKRILIDEAATNTKRSGLKINYTSEFGVNTLYIEN